MRIDTGINIDAPAEAVWDLLMQPARYPEFATPSDEITDLGDGVVQEGYVYKERGGIPPFKSEMTWTVASVHPNERLVTTGNDGKVTIRAEWILDDRADGSHLAHYIELDPIWYLAPVMGVMWPLMMRSRAQEALDGTMANIKRIVEAA